MMGLFDNILYWTNVISILAVVVFVLGMGGLFYFKKIWKPKTHREKIKRYEDYKREDSKYYVPIDDIQGDMIITDDYTRFIAIINCFGSDYDRSNVSECISKQLGYLSLFKVIDGPIQKRYHCRNVDLEENIQDYNKIQGELIKVTEEKQLNMVSIAKKLGDGNERSSEHSILTDKYNELLREVDNNIWRIKHIENIIEYMEEMSGSGVEPIREDTYCIDWTYVKSPIAVELDNNERIKRAREELTSKINQVKSALSNARVRVKRLNDVDLEECIRNHNQVISSSIYKYKDINESNAEFRIVTSTSLDELEKKHADMLNSELIDILRG